MLLGIRPVSEFFWNPISLANKSSPTEVGIVPVIALSLAAK